MNLAAGGSLVYVSRRCGRSWLQGPVTASEPLWTISITQNPAKYNSLRLVAILINSPLRLDTDDEPDGVAFAPGPISGGIDNPSGRVVFIDGRHRAMQI